MSCGCTICSESFVLSRNTPVHDDVSATGCGHTFHGRCLNAWLAVRKICPMCRVPVKARRTIKKLFFEAEIIPTGTDLVALGFEIETLKARVSERESQIEQLKSSVSESQQKYDLAIHQHKEAQDVIETELNKMKVEVDLVRQRHQGELTTKEALLQSMSKETAKWKSAADTEAKKVSDLEKAAAEWAAVSERLPPETLKQARGNVKWVWDTRFLQIAIIKLRGEINKKDISRRELLDKLAQNEATHKATADRHLAETEDAEQSRQTLLEEIDHLRAELGFTNQQQHTSETPENIPLADPPMEVTTVETPAQEETHLLKEIGDLKAALKSQTKTADYFRQALVEKIRGLKSIEDRHKQALAAVDRERQEALTDFTVRDHQEAASWRTALQLEQESHGVTRGQLETVRQERNSLRVNLRDAQELLPTRIKLENETRSEAILEAVNDPPVINVEDEAAAPLANSTSPHILEHETPVLPAASPPLAVASTSTSHATSQVGPRSVRDGPTTGSVAIGAQTGAQPEPGPTHQAVAAEDLPKREPVVTMLTRKSTPLGSMHVVQDGASGSSSSSTSAPSSSNSTSSTNREPTAEQSTNVQRVPKQVKRKRPEASQSPTPNTATKVSRPSD